MRIVHLRSPSLEKVDLEGGALRSFLPGPAQAISEGNSGLDADFLICGETWFHDARTSLSWLARRGTGDRIFTLGLVAPSKIGPADEDALRALHSLSGTLLVRDDYSRAWIEEVIGEGSARVAGPTILLYEDTPFLWREERQVFCPPLDPKLGGFASALYRALHRRRKTLFLALEKNELSFGAEPGGRTLFSPREPQVALKALISAARIVSFRLEPLLVAIRHGALGLLITADPAEERLAEQLGIPVQRLGENPSLGETVARVDQLDHLTCWEETRRALGEMRNQLVDHLREIDATFPMVSKESSLSESASSAKASPLTACCIADSEYLPFFVGLYENLSAVHGENLEIHLLALEDSVSEFVRQRQSRCKIVLYRLEDLWSEDELSRIVSRRIPDMAYASKARLLGKALQATSRPVFYFDLDVYFFRSPQPLTKRLRENSVLLFPQWNDVLPDYRMNGLFNAGMICVAPGAERFLSWWAELCLYYYNRDQREGYREDQGLLDLALLYFKDVEIYRDADENIASWNLVTLAPLLDFKDGTNYPVGSFHACMPDYQGLFEIKFAWDEAAAFFSPLSDLERNLSFKLNALMQQKGHWEGANRLYYLRYIMQRASLPNRLSDFLFQVGRKIANTPAYFIVDTGIQFFFLLRYLSRQRRRAQLVRSQDRWVEIQRRAVQIVNSREVAAQSAAEAHTIEKRARFENRDLGYCPT